jgi:nicotinamidase-related amidase
MEKNSKGLNTALLIMDIQPTTMGMLGDHASVLLTPLKKAIAAARKNNILVLYVVVSFRKGIPEITSATTNTGFAMLSSNAAIRPGLENAGPDPALGALPAEMVVAKRRVSAFAGSDLEVILRGHKIDHLVLTGVATSGVVLSTIRQAADMDYTLSVLSDACADRDPEVHSVLLNKVFPRQAEVLSVDHWVAGLGG